MGDTQMKEKPSPLGHLQSRPQFPLNQLGGSSHLPSSQGTTPTSRTHVKKNLRATAAVSEDDEGTNQEMGRQGVVARTQGWEAGEPALAVTNLLGDLGPVPSCQGTRSPPGCNKEAGRVGLGVAVGK